MISWPRSLRARSTRSISTLHSSESATVVYSRTAARARADRPRARPAGRSSWRSRRMGWPACSCARPCGYRWGCRRRPRSARLRSRRRPGSRPPGAPEGGVGEEGPLVVHDGVGDLVIAVRHQCVGDGFAQRFGRPIGPPSYEANAGRITTKNREMIVTTHHTPLPPSMDMGNNQDDFNSQWREVHRSRAAATLGQSPPALFRKWAEQRPMGETPMSSAIRNHFQRLVACACSDSGGSCSSSIRTPFGS